MRKPLGLKRKAGKLSRKEAQPPPGKETWTSRIRAKVKPSAVIDFLGRSLASLEQWLATWPVYTLPLVLFLGLMVYALAIPQTTILDPDTGWLIRTGELILQDRGLPAKDVFSFTQGDRPWILYQWLFEVYLGLLHRLADLGGVVWGAALMIALTYALLLGFLIRQGLPRLAGVALVLLAMLVTRFYWYARPNTFTLLAFMALLLRLEGYRLSPKGRLWDLPLLFLLWANIHLGFLLGLAVVLLYGAWAWLAPGAFRGGGERDRRLLLIFPFCLGATFLNPYGFHLLTYFWRLAQAPTMNSSIIELRSPDFHFYPLYFFVLQLVLLLWLGGGAYAGRSLVLTLVSLTLVMALYAGRNIPFFAFTAALHLGYCLKTRGSAPPPVLGPPGRGAVWTALVAVLTLAVVTGLGFWRPGLYNFDPRFTPQGAASYLSRLEPAPQPLKVFVHDGQWASYLIYRLYPRIRVFIDSRFDMYGDEAFARFLAFQRVVSFNPAIITPWGVDFLVLQKARLSAPPRLGPAWIKVYEDSQAMIYQAHREAAAPTEPYNPYR